jgi:hypothetical protein
MPSTVALNCMTGHRIICTIPAAIATAGATGAGPGTRDDDVITRPSGRAMIFPWGLRSDRVSLPAGTRALVR